MDLHNDNLDNLNDSLEYIFFINQNGSFFVVVENYLKDIRKNAIKNNSLSIFAYMSNRHASF